MKTHLKITGIFFLLLLAVAVGCNEEVEVIPAPQNRLVAVAGDDMTIKVNEAVSLDGSESHDGNNKPFVYGWSVKTKPQGSTATIGVSNTAKTTFTPDVVGKYIIELKITQGSWLDTDELALTVVARDEPNPPATITLSEPINTATTLMDILEDPLQPDYLVTNDIEVRADLAIMPGVVVAFKENKGLQIISGSIRAKGNPDSGILFRGLNEQPAYWKGIVIHSNSDMNELEFVKVKHAGSSTFPETGVKANVTLAGTDISGAALKVRHTVFSESGGYGLYVQGMSVLNHFSNNAFFSNAAMAAYIPASQLHKIDVVSFTGTDGLETGGPVLEESEVTWKKLVSGSYVVSGNILIRAGVTIQPGTIFKMKTGATINVSDNGYLNASGSEAFNIIFTSEANNMYWNGLFFNSFNGNNRLKYCEISNAGLNRIADADYLANIVVSNRGSVTVENSIIKNGLGYGLVTKDIDRVNQDLILVNSFDNLQSGMVYPAILNYPDLPAVTGIWLDYWSFNHSATDIADDFYNKDTGLWFDGAANPWKMSEAGFGIRINENGTFTWNIAESHSMTGCESYSAEYITGTAMISSGVITFNQEYWRSKFVSACDPSWNMDTEVETSVITLPYEITRMYNAFLGKECWKITFINPDGSTFSFYRL